MTLLVCADGTSMADSNEAYRAELHDSFVRRIYLRSRIQKIYHPGPDLLGGACLGATQRLRRWVWDNRDEGEEVLLAGYSRGAAIVVALAQLLHGDEVPVRALMMFDCVDRAFD